MSVDLTNPQVNAAGSPPRVHLGYLDGLRALAALFVVFHHVWLHFGGRGWGRVGGLTWDERLTGVFYYGHYAVDVFIVLSGFCLMLPIVRGDGTLRGGALLFFKKRARRILPPYYAACLAAIAIPWIMAHYSPPSSPPTIFVLTPKAILAHLLLVEDAFKENSGVYLPSGFALWSVAVEWRIYFAFPLFVLAWSRLGPFKATALTALASLVLFVLLAPFHSHLNFTATGISPQYLALFAFGCLACGIAYGRNPPLARLRQSLPWPVVTLGSLLVVILISEVNVLHHRPLPIQATDFFVGVWASCLLVLAALGEGNPLRRVLEWKPLVMLGTFAYSLFLFHVTFLLLFWKYVQPHLHAGPMAQFLLTCGVGIPILIGVSYLFFLACERPFLNTRRRETMAQTAQEAALSPAP